MSLDRRRNWPQNNEHGNDAEAECETNIEHKPDDDDNIKDSLPGYKTLRFVKVILTCLGIH
ncbi:hypothetical protein RAB80_016965 [Fusarium oxysporum f. sp. vasinfectum]|nr:hypothetical protein RAB80_016965 [Fusarium oxysporum f. sp. vasinfectum]